MRKPALLSTTVALLAVVVAIFLWIELRAERELSAQLHERVAGLEAQLGNVQVSPANRLPATPGQAPTVPGLVPAVAATAASPSATGALNAELCETQRDRLRESLRRSQAGLVDALSLSQAESDAMVDLALSQVNLAGPACGELRREVASQAQFEAEVQRLLGPVRFEAYEEYRAAQLNRSNMATLRSQLASTNLPLTPEQERRLDEIIVQEQRRTRSLQSGRVPPEDPLARLKYEEEGIALTEDRFSSVLAAAQGHLDARQLDVLKANMDRQVATQRSAIAARRAHIEAGGDPNQASGPVLVLAP